MSEPSTITIDRAEMLKVLQPLFDQLDLNINAAKAVTLDTWGVTIELVYSAKPGDRIPPSIHITDHQGMDVSPPSYLVSVPYSDAVPGPCSNEHEGVGCSGLAGHLAPCVFEAVS